LSPDGKRLAYGRLGNPGGWDIWVRDLARGADTRFTVGPGMDVYGIWSPSGDEIVYSSAGDGTFLELFRKAASGAGEPEQLTNEGTGPRAGDWSGDDQFLLFHTVVRRDLMAMQARGEKKVFPVVATPFTETHGR
jgi:Tol biopolymer transport system component